MHLLSEKRNASRSFFLTIHRIFKAWEDVNNFVNPAVSNRS